MNGRTILLVEDNPDDVDLTLLAFRKANIGNDVIVAKDGEEALDFFFGRGSFAHRGEDGELPGLVLLDLKLPKVSGLDVLRELQKFPKFCSLPVVMLTSSKEEEDIKTAYELGAKSYLHKPVDFDRFIEVTGKVGLYWLLLNELPPNGL